MHDMLARLYDLPDTESRVAALHDVGVDVRRALVPERHRVVSWVRQHFGEGWASECELSFGRLPGTALLLATLHAMAAEGYAYAIIGGFGPAEFYSKAVGAVPIAGSTPGIYANMLGGGRAPGQKTQGTP